MDYRRGLYFLFVLCVALSGCKDNKKASNVKAEVKEEANVRLTDLDEVEIKVIRNNNQSENNGVETVDSKLDRLRGILAVENNEVQVDPLEYEIVDEKRISADYKAGLEYRKDLDRVRLGTIHLKDREIIKKEERIYTRNEIAELMFDLLMHTALKEDKIYEDLKLKSYTEVTALTLDLTTLRRVRRSLNTDLNAVENYKKELPVTLESMEEILRYKRSSGSFSVNGVREYIRNLDTFASNLEVYYKMVIAFNMDIEKNWESFEDEFGVRIIRDPNYAAPYKNMSEEIIKQRERVERAHIRVAKQFLDLRKIYE